MATVGGNGGLLGDGPYDTASPKVSTAEVAATIQ
jgi:hypothetical protein